MSAVREIRAGGREDSKNVEIWDPRCKLTKEGVDIGAFWGWIWQKIVEILLSVASPADFLPFYCKK